MEELVNQTDEDQDGDDLKDADDVIITDGEVCTPSSQPTERLFKPWKEWLSFSSSKVMYKNLGTAKQYSIEHFFPNSHTCKTH